MKNIAFTILASAILCACQSTPSNKDADLAEPRTTVTLTHARPGKIRQYIELPATTIYLGKTVVAAPISGFIVKSFVKPGKRVSAGQILYRIESKEQHALATTHEKGITITAHQSGIVLDVQITTGCYAAENTTLCSIVDENSMAFEIDVPYEQHDCAKDGNKCTIVLPDGKHVNARISLPLATMDVASQTQRVVAYASAPFLPEGMNVRALIETKAADSAQGLILPKGSVQSNETMTEHWVMKLVDDSTAIRVPVEICAENSTETEIKAGTLSVADRIVHNGAYGLGDSTKISIAK